MMQRFADAIQHRVAHVQIRRSHIDLGPQHPRAVGELAVAHPLKQLQILPRRAVAIRAVRARLGRRAAMPGDLVQRQLADKRLAGLDQLDREAVELFKIIGGEVNIFAPVEAEPLHVLLDRIDVLDVLLGRVRVVKAQMANAALVLDRDAEVQADRLGMANVQVAVRLRRETCHRRGMFAAGQVGSDDLADEIERLRLGLAVVGSRGIVVCVTHLKWLAGHAAAKRAA